MVENTLFEALETYNKVIPNKYKENWGSLLSFIGKYRKLGLIQNIFTDAEDTNMLTKKSDFMQRVDKQKLQSFLPTHTGQASQQRPFGGQKSIKGGVMAS